MLGQDYRKQAKFLGVKENLELMKTLDDAWNAGPNSPLWETFKNRHREDVKVYWPAQPIPTVGRHNHDVEAVEFFKTFVTNLSIILIKLYLDKETIHAPLLIGL